MTWLPFLVPSSGDEWERWAVDDAPKLAGIIIAVLAVRLVTGPIGRRVLGISARQAGRLRGEAPEVTERRIATVQATVTWVVTLLAGFIGIAVALDVLGVNVAPLIAGVGVAGIALGLGAQTLIKDVINGIFIIVEDQYAVGDVVRIADVSGQVVEITPRRTVLRDQDGILHTIPNSAVVVASNMTRDFSRINLNVAVAYEEDLGRVMQLINGECEALAAERPEDFLVAPKVLRVDSLGDSGVVIKVTGDVRPAKQWDLMGELRLRIKNRFDAEGVEIPYPHQTQVPWRASPPGADGEARA
jgi:small conductance mechanosensitive channel